MLRTNHISGVNQVSSVVWGSKGGLSRSEDKYNRRRPTGAAGHRHPGILPFQVPIRRSAFDSDVEKHLDLAAQSLEA